MRVRQELRADALVARVPRAAAVVGSGRRRRSRSRSSAVRDRDGSRSDRVQAETAAARLPLLAVRVFPQALVQAPGLAARPATRRAPPGSTPQYSVSGSSARPGRDLPDVLERRARRFGKPHERRLGPRPPPAEVVAPARAPRRSACSTAPAHIRRRPPRVSSASGVDGRAREVGPGDFPAASRGARPEQEERPSSCPRGGRRRRRARRGPSAGESSSSACPESTRNGAVEFSGDVPVTTYDRRPSLAIQLA